MKKILTTIALLISGASNAQTVKLDMEPGLWQQSFKISSQSGEMEQMLREAQQQIAALPEAQRKMMEEMLKAQGISFDGVNGSVEVCVTEEEIAQGMLPDMDECSQQLTQLDKNRFQFSFSCATEPASSGSGEIIFSDRKNYQGKANFVTEVNGKQEPMQLEQQGRWIAANCKTQ